MTRSISLRLLYIYDLLHFWKCNSLQLLVTVHVVVISYYPALLVRRRRQVIGTEAAWSTAKHVATLPRVMSATPTCPPGIINMAFIAQSTTCVLREWVCVSERAKKRSKHMFLFCRVGQSAPTREIRRQRAASSMALVTFSQVLVPGLCVAELPPKWLWNRHHEAAATINTRLSHFVLCRSTDSGTVVDVSSRLVPRRTQRCSNVR